MTTQSSDTHRTPRPLRPAPPQAPPPPRLPAARVRAPHDQLRSEGVQTEVEVALQQLIQSRSSRFGLTAGPAPNSPGVGRQSGRPIAMTVTLRTAAYLLDPPVRRRGRRRGHGACARPQSCARAAVASRRPSVPHTRSGPGTKRRARTPWRWKEQSEDSGATVRARHTGSASSSTSQVRHDDRRRHRHRGSPQAAQRRGGRTGTGRRYRGRTTRPGRRGAALFDPRGRGAFLRRQRPSPPAFLAGPPLPDGRTSQCSPVS